MAAPVRGTPARPEDRTNTAQLILLNFKNQTEVNVSLLPGQEKNLAFRQFARHDALIARSEITLQETDKALKTGETMGTQLLAKTKNNETANATIFTQVNHLKQLAEPVTMAKQSITKLKTEKPEDFKNALKIIIEAPNKTEMTSIELGRQRDALATIQKQAEKAVELQAEVTPACKILKDYDATIKVAATPAKRGEPGMLPPQPTS